MKNDIKTTLLLHVVLVSPKEAETIMEVLTANPELPVESKDDAKCERLFRELGMMNLFNVANDRNLSVVKFRDHKIHWIFGLRWSRYPQPGQIEYRVFCLPKARMTEEGVEAFADSVTKT